MNPFMFDGAAYSDALFEEAYGDSYGGWSSNYNPWDDPKQRQKLKDEWYKTLTKEDKQRYAMRQVFSKNCSELLYKFWLADMFKGCCVVIDGELYKDNLWYTIYTPTIKKYTELDKNDAPKPDEFVLCLQEKGFIKFVRFNKFKNSGIIVCNSSIEGEILIFNNEENAKEYLYIQQINKLI